MVDPSVDWRNDALCIDRSECSGSRHGDSNAYRHYGCRCPDATAANTLYGKMWRAGLVEPVWVDNTGVVRRRQALAAIGWGLSDLEPYFGINWRGLGGHASRRKVRQDTFERWRKVYELLSMTPGPNETARKRARARGWAPPLAWDDIDDPDEQPSLGVKRARDRSDVASEARHLLGFGMAMPAVAKQLKVSEEYLRLILGGGKRAAA